MIRTIVRDAALVAALSVVLSLGVNAVRKDGIPLVQKKEYDILVPCPEPSGEVTELKPGDPLVKDGDSLLVDARGKTEYEAWHVQGAINVIFDYLDPVAQDDIRRIAKTRAKRIVVYGDGDDPDSGKELAKVLSGSGVRNVHFVAGGAAALKGATP